MSRLRRTMLYVPGNSPGMLRDAEIYPADCVLFDLEDSVAQDEKDAARLLVREALRTMDYDPEKEIFVRVNHLDTVHGLADLEAVVPTGRAGIRMPKAETADDVRASEEQIARIERECGLRSGVTRMMVAVESARGVLNAPAIAAASSRLVAIAIGAEDYTTDLRANRSVCGEELAFGRSMVLHAARAAGIDAIDTVYSDVNNEEGLRDEVRLIRQLGFDGKSVINPRQIAVVHELFAPSCEEIERAREIIEALKQAQTRGSGVVSLNGRMIDKPVADRAARVLRLAATSGCLQKEVRP